MYIVVGVDPNHSSRKFFICSMDAKRAFGNVDLGLKKEDTHLNGPKNKDIYGSEEPKFKVIFRRFTMPVS